MLRKGLKSDLIVPDSAKNVLFFDSAAKRELRLNVARKTVIMPPRLAGGYARRISKHRLLVLIATEKNR
jgi:hypothetical protein